MPDDATEPLVVREDRGDGVGGLVLNRPERLNALGYDVIGALVDHLDACVADPDVAVVVLRGAGRAFSAGADASPDAVVDEQAIEQNRIDLLEKGFGRFFALWDAPKPVIAQVHGYCLGLGMVLCNFVDVVMVADDATIGWPSLPLGGGVEGPAWVFHVGARKAKEYAFQASARLTGSEAAAAGWANQAVPPDELHDATQALAARMAKTPPGLLRIKKESINRIYDQMGFRDSMRLAATWAALSHTDPGAAEVLDLVREHGIKSAIDHYRG